MSWLLTLVLRRILTSLKPIPFSANIDHKSHFMNSRNILSTILMNFNSLQTVKIHRDSKNVSIYFCSIIIVRYKLISIKIAQFCWMDMPTKFYWNRFIFDQHRAKAKLAHLLETQCTYWVTLVINQTCKQKFNAYWQESMICVKLQ